MKTRAKPAAEQAQPSNDDHSHGVICHHVAKVRAVAQLLEHVTEDMYDNQVDWEGVAMQVEILSEALTERVQGLEETVAECERMRTRPAKAA